MYTKVLKYLVSSEDRNLRKQRRKQADKGLEFEYKENTKLMNLQMFNFGSIIKDGLRSQMYKDEDSQISLH